MIMKPNEIVFICMILFFTVSIDRYIENQPMVMLNALLALFTGISMVIFKFSNFGRNKKRK